MTHVFVTGGSGFLGRRLVGALVERGVTVRALVRSASSGDVVTGCGATAVGGDLGDKAALSRGMAGCDTVFHLAALLKIWGDPAEFTRVNVDGTRNVLEAARHAGVSRLIFVSTDAAYAGPAPLVRIDDATPRPARPYGVYGWTKGQAEDMVIAANSAALTTVVVRPRMLWGRGDTSLLPRIADVARQGRFRWIGDGNHLSSTTHVANACEGLLLAAERGQGGVCYPITDGPPLTFRRFMTDMLATQGVDPGARSIPAGVARVAAVVVEVVWRACRIRRDPPITRAMVKMVGEEVTLDDSRARRELGYVGRVSYADGFREMREATPSRGASPSGRAGPAVTTV